MPRTYAIYILASRSRRLYTGVTGDLDTRVLQHHLGTVPGFTTRYRIFRLVHFELFGDIRDAIAREKQIKVWHREQKIRLIEHKNPAWHDLAARLPHVYATQNTQSRSRSRSSNSPERLRDDNKPL